MTTADDIERLFRANFKAMLTLAARMVHDEDAARDIVHDVFASLLADCPESVSTAYLLNGVRFACLNHIRSQSIRQRLEQLYPYDMADADDESVGNEAADWLNSVVDSALSEQCRRVVRLRFAARLTYKEIAEELGVSEVTVYKHLRHALDVLRQKFHEHER